MVQDVHLLLVLPEERQELVTGRSENLCVADAPFLHLFYIRVLGYLSSWFHTKRSLSLQLEYKHVEYTFIRKKKA
jgi:hypothetical protein